MLTELKAENSDLKKFLVGFCGRLRINGCGWQASMVCYWRILHRIDRRWQFAVYELPLEIVDENEHRLFLKYIIMLLCYLSSPLLAFKHLTKLIHGAIVIAVSDLFSSNLKLKCINSVYNSPNEDFNRTHSHKTLNGISLRKHRDLKIQIAGVSS